MRIRAFVSLWGWVCHKNNNKKRLLDGQTELKVVKCQITLRRVEVRDCGGGQEDVQIMWVADSERQEQHNPFSKFHLSFFVIDRNSTLINS